MQSLDESVQVRAIERSSFAAAKKEGNRAIDSRLKISESRKDMVFRDKIMQMKGVKKVRTGKCYECNIHEGIRNKMKFKSDIMMSKILINDAFR
uniref:Uncharacterized protein n=1 Tax=Romanomermis culicivorax TaxID=13658 RepID=A0A915JUA6_ROMCU